MPFYAVSPKHEPKTVYVCGGPTSTDAVLDAYQRYDPDHYEEHLEEAGGFNQVAEDLLATTFNCTEIHRHDVLEYVERRLDGDSNIGIIL